jgi:hypothetical protein
MTRVGSRRERHPCDDVPHGASHPASFTHEAQRAESACQSSPAPAARPDRRAYARRHQGHRRTGTVLDAWASAQSAALSRHGGRRTAASGQSPQRTSLAMEDHTGGRRPVNMPRPLRYIFIRSRSASSRTTPFPSHVPVNDVGPVARTSLVWPPTAGKVSRACRLMALAASRGHDCPWPCVLYPLPTSTSTEGRTGPARHRTLLQVRGIGRIRRPASWRGNTHVPDEIVHIRREGSCLDAPVQSTGWRLVRSAALRGRILGEPAWGYARLATRNR